MAATDRPAPRAYALRQWLVRETTGGALLLGAAAIALLWANSPWRGSYATLGGTTVGPASLHLDLSLSTWAADGLLAVFFFVVGIELKQELVTGSLRNPRHAAVPVLAAVGGMIAPALVFAGLVVALGEPGALHGWAVPTATDIAFALAVLAVFGRGLPPALRTFLLTLAVVDDLLAIVVIAVFYTSDIDGPALAAALACVALFAALAQLRVARPWLLIAVALAAWYFLHASGVHATVAGVLLGLSVPARPVHDERLPRTLRFDAALRPLSAGIVLPVFAFFAAGVTLDGGALELAGQPVFVAVFAGLALGKVLGVLGTTAAVTRLTPLRLPASIGLRDLLPVGFLTGIGFTVSLLVAGLSFPDDAHVSAAKAAVLAGSLVSAVVSAVALRVTARHRRARAS